MRGEWLITCCDPDGRLVKATRFPNIIMTAGRNYMLDAALRGQTAITTWYAGIIDNGSFTKIAAADTMSSHAGWVESTAYSEATRPTWTAGPAGGGAIRNSNSISVTLNAAVTARGAFLVSDSTKGGTSGTLFSAGKFATAEAYASGMVLTLQYVVKPV